MTAFAAALDRVVRGQTLEAEEMRAAFGLLLDGQVDPVAAGAFLTALRMRGETAPEIAAAATAMRERVQGFPGPIDAIDTCGTGGDGAETFNISTGTAIVLAACGVPVAKHGNRAVSSRSGSSDVMTALGVRIDMDRAAAAQCLDRIGLAFLFAPLYHPAVAHVAPVRRALGFRTLFNLLGPLANPAGARRHLLGVYDPRLVEPIASTLLALGSQAAWVVHGADGLDELTVTGESHVGILANGTIRLQTITPEDAGLRRHPIGALRGGDASANAAALRDVLAGAQGAYRDAIVLNAAAGLMIAGVHTSLEVAAGEAAVAIDAGAAASKLEALRAFSMETV